MLLGRGPNAIIPVIFTSIIKVSLMFDEDFYNITITQLQRVQYLKRFANKENYLIWYLTGLQITAGDW